MTWLYRRERIAVADARWSTRVDADSATFAATRAAVESATVAVIEAWGRQAPEVTGRTARQLWSLTGR